jgi:AcrR family transcriptional regulator
MVRKAEFDKDTFFEATLELIKHGGLSAVTMKAIAVSAKAPTGSIYHRFSSRSTLLCELWENCLSSLTNELLAPLQTGQIDAAVQNLCHWVKSHPNKARLLMLFEESDVIDRAPDPISYKKINKLHQTLANGLTQILLKKSQVITPENMALVNYALFEGPISAFKPYLRGNKSLFPQCEKIALACSKSAMNQL